MKKTNKIKTGKKIQTKKANKQTNKQTNPKTSTKIKQNTKGEKMHPSVKLQPKIYSWLKIYEM